MRVIGITGGIGSGKTTVSGYLRSLGYEVIDADGIARDLAESEDVLHEIRDMFGDSVLKEDGSLDRKRMAEIVFSDIHKKEMLEAIITDRVVARCAEIIQGYREDENASGPVFLDAPLLFETGADRLVDEIWSVACDVDKRIERAKLRDDSLAEDIEARIAAQLPDDDRAEKADVVISNDGTVDELKCSIDSLLEKY